MTSEELEDAHKFSSLHRDLVDQSETCGCFYCLEVFKSTEIHEWIDNKQTAMCPHCGIDSVIPDITNLLKEEKFLEQMSKHWFVYLHTDQAVS